MNEDLYEHFIRLIGLLAQDVFSENSLLETIDSMALPSSVHRALTREVADAYGFESSGYDDPRVYVEHVKTVLGYRHERLIGDLRAYAYTKAP